MLHGCLEIRNFSPCLKNISLVHCAHSWNIFQHLKRNFVSPHGHVISSIYVIITFHSSKPHCHSFVYLQSYSHCPFPPGTGPRRQKKRPRQAESDLFYLNAVYIDQVAIIISRNKVLLTVERQGLNISFMHPIYLVATFANKMKISPVTGQALC